MTKGAKTAFFGPVLLIAISALIIFISSLAGIKSLRTFAFLSGTFGILLLPIGIVIGIILLIINRRPTNPGQ